MARLAAASRREAVSRTAFVIALLGAESTGKTTLCAEIAAALSAHGRRVTQVTEALREFCALHARTPRQDEQMALAQEQARRIDAAAKEAEVVVADTTALMIAVYSELVFADRSLYAFAEAEQGRIDLTLLTALDLPWQADGLQRDGAHVRVPVDALVRAALARAAATFEVVSGSGPSRLASALASISRALQAAGR
jgi:nicotinamide riboside kinase